MMISDLLKSQKGHKMKILSVDTAGGVASAAITDGEKLVCEVIVNNKKTHSQTIMPIIDSILKQAEIKLGDVDLIAAAGGPGSFTGLRIGVSVVKGMAHAADKPIVCVSSLTSMAYSLPYCEYIISPIMDARREQVYNAVYEWQDGELKEMEAPRALGISELCEELAKYDKKTVFLGDGVPVYKEIIIDKLGDKAVFAPSCANAQRASALAVPAEKMFKEGKYQNCFDVAPTYLRKSQAEREAEKKNK